MEVVHVFNKELKSILESKLPVSRHKMSLITKSAMKALKFYKHVVQSVEKFITKCSCEYKVPGLYVIDAILRQSKHQYCDKDVFVPRFLRNIVKTFIHLSQCDQKDLISVERVLRLWQQNGVYSTDLVEALLELVYDASDTRKVIKAGEIVLRLVNDWNGLKGKPEEKLEVFIPHIDIIVETNDTSLKTEGGLIDSITKLLTRFQAETGQDVALEIDQIQILHQKIVEQSALLAQGVMIDSDTLSQLHLSMEELTKKAAKAAAVQQSKLAMLAEDEKDPMTEASTDLEFVEQLQQMVDTLGQTRALQEELKQALESQQNTESDITGVITVNTDLNELEEGEEPYTTENSTDEAEMRLIPNNYLPSMYDNHSDRGSLDNESYDGLSTTSSCPSRKRRRSDSDVEYVKRVRSRSREHKRKEKRNSDSRKRFMPSLRQHFVAVMSHTMFIGHLHKHVSESKLRSLCEKYGSIAEFNMIPPRGCAFVTFDRRKGAYKAIDDMNDLKFEGRNLKVAWAPNKGVKDDKEFRGLWVEHEGATYIPIEQFPINRSTELTIGLAELDEESLTEELKQAIYQFEQQKSEAVARGLEPSSVDTMISVAAEVVNKNIPLIGAGENIIDAGTPFFNQFSAPPPMIPFTTHPPHHMFMGGPMPNPMAGNMSSYMDYQGSISATLPVQNNHNSSNIHTCGAPVIAHVSVSYSSSDNSHSMLLHNASVPPPALTPYTRSALFTPNPLAMSSRARYSSARPPHLRFTRPPPPPPPPPQSGYASYRPRPPATRY